MTVTQPQTLRQRNRSPIQSTQVNLDTVNNNGSVLNDPINLSTVPTSVQVSKQALKSRKFWVRIFLVVFIPFALIGFPIHIILARPKKGGDTTREELDENTWSYWCEYRFQTKISAILTIILLPWSLVINAYALLKVSSIFNNLVIKGVFTEQDLLDVLTIAYMSPYLAMMNYTWIYGDSLNRLIRSFGKPITVATHPPVDNYSTQRILPINDDTRQTDSTELEANFDVNTDPDLVRDRFKGPNALSILPNFEESNIRTNLIVTYGLTLFVHILHYFITKHRLKIEEWSDDQVTTHLRNYMYTITYTLMLPVYHCFCGAILCQIYNLNRFIENLIYKREKMQLVHIYLIKKAYTIIGDSIVHVNSFSRLLLAWLLILLYFTSGYRASPLILYLFDAIKETANTINGTSSTTNDTTSTESTVGIDTSEPTDVVVGIPPVAVRFFVGVAVESFLYIYLMRATLMSAIEVNDESRYLLVRLNDLATELASSTGYNMRPVDSYHSRMGKQYYVDSDVYRAFRLLKLYVHSRMEAHVPHQQALLNVLEIALLLPGMPLLNRVSGYNLIH